LNLASHPDWEATTVRAEVNADDSSAIMAFLLPTPRGETRR
jgi:hypothetical protein